MTAGAVAVRDETVEVWDSRLRLHVKIAGDGPPLLYFHPLPGLAWQPLLDQLARRYTVYAPEHPGTSPGDPQAIREGLWRDDAPIPLMEMVSGSPEDTPKYLCSWRARAHRSRRKSSTRRVSSAVASAS
jgi:pimeloyl-ACP methyl ester carboxylesterase